MSDAGNNPSSLAFMLRALRYRNYRLFFGGQIVSLIGTWMTEIATSWLVYRLTGSALLLGVVGFAGQFPAFLLSPVAGSLIDRWDRRRILVATQTLSMLASLTLAALTLGGIITIPMLIGVNIARGMVNAFDMPCRQAFVVEMIEKREDLGNAIALNSSTFNLARLLGPSIGGLVIAAVGEGWCFFIDGVSFIAVIAALLAMQATPHPGKAHEDADALAHMKEGWRYVLGSVPIRSIILLLALIGLVGFPYAVLIPVFAGKILGGGPHTLGFLMASSGCGALLGSVWLASRRTVRGLVRIIPLAAGIFGVGLILFSFSRSLWLSLPLVLIAGFGLIVQMASSNTIVQTIVDDDKRGRVMSLYVMAFLGALPIGSLLAGVTADAIGAPATLALSGAGCILGALWFAGHLPEIRQAIRPIYVRMGIVPELKAGIETASRFAIAPDAAPPR